MHILANPKLFFIWDPVIEKFKKHLSTWKEEEVPPFGGRITITKSSLSSLSVYFMSIYKMHLTVASDKEVRSH